MDKELNRGTKTFKQWRGAFGGKHPASFNDLKKVITGGVPRLLPTQCVYQLQSNSVANKGLQKCR
jgi:hypothetical protein